MLNFTFSKQNVMIDDNNENNTQDIIFIFSLKFSDCTFCFYYDIFVKSDVEKLKNMTLRGKFGSFDDPHSLNDARRTFVDLNI